MDKKQIEGRIKELTDEGGKWVEERDKANRVLEKANTNLLMINGAVSELGKLISDDISTSEDKE